MNKNRKSNNLSITNYLKVNENNQRSKSAVKFKQVKQDEQPMPKIFNEEINSLSNKLESNEISIHNKGIKRKYNETDMASEKKEEEFEINKKRKK